MINKLFTTKVVKVEKVESVVCDNCKRTVEDSNIIELQKFISIRHTCGYGDYSDGDRIECDLCGDCWPKLLPFRLIEEENGE